MATAKISCTTVNIGVAPYIVISDVTGATNWTLSWEFGSQSGTIAQLTTAKTFNNYVWPLSFYNEIPDRMNGSGVLYLDLWDGMIYAGRVAQPFTVKVNTSSSAPTVFPRVVQDNNSTTVALTGDNTKLVRYVSTALVSWDITVRNGATFDSTNGVVTYNGSQVGYTITPRFFGPESNKFTVEVTDSRGLTTVVSYTHPAEKWVEYIKPTCHTGGEMPDGNGNMTLTCSGNYYNGSFGAVSNTLSVQYRYKENGGAFSAWQSMAVSKSGNTYKASVSLTNLNYKSTYVFECRATDKCMTVTSAENTATATPVFHWSESDFVHETPVDFRAGIMINGKDAGYIVEQGTKSGWTYRKWSNGFAECWGTYNVTVTASSWTQWGALYQAEVIMNENYPFTFKEIPKETATLRSFAGSMLACGEFGGSTSTTSAYFAVHPNKLTSSYGHILELYVVGQWK
jgi:hypothetical protein